MLPLLTFHLSVSSTDGDSRARCGSLASKFASVTKKSGRSEVVEFSSSLETLEPACLTDVDSADEFLNRALWRFFCEQTFANFIHFSHL